MTISLQPVQARIEELEEAGEWKNPELRTLRLQMADIEIKIRRTYLEKSELGPQLESTEDEIQQRSKDFWDIFTQHIGPQTVEAFRVAAKHDLERYEGIDEPREEAKIRERHLRRLDPEFRIPEKTRNVKSYERVMEIAEGVKQSRARRPKKPPTPVGPIEVEVGSVAVYDPYYPIETPGGWYRIECRRGLWEGSGSFTESGLRSLTIGIPDIEARDSEWRRIASDSGYLAIVDGAHPLRKGGQYGEPGTFFGEISRPRAQPVITLEPNAVGFRVDKEWEFIVTIHRDDVSCFQIDVWEVPRDDPAQIPWDELGVRAPEEE